jgi:hypothetical protein
LEEKEASTMNKILDALKRATPTHILLFSIAVLMAMNWWEMRGINKALTSTAKWVQFTDGDLSSVESDLTDINNNLSEIETDLTNMQQ